MMHAADTTQAVDVTETPAYSFEESGLHPQAIESYKKLLDEALATLPSGGNESEQRVWIVPGRIEVLGKHVDYAGGRSLLCAIDRGIVVVARPHDDRTLVVRDAIRREALSVPLHARRAHARGLPWSIYPETVIRRLNRNFGDALTGCDVAIASNLPPAAGVSSSSALTVGLTIAMAAISKLPTRAVWQSAIPDRIALAGYVGALENGHDFGMLDGEAGVGTMGGAQDQTAILNCHARQLDVFSWKPVRHERTVPFPDALRFVIGVSGVVAAKTGAAKERYNRAARTAHLLVDAWNRRAERPVATLAEAFEAAWSLHGGNTGDVPSELVRAARNMANAEFGADHLEARLHQFHGETWKFVPGAAQAFADGNIARFGEIAAASQAGAEHALENQIAETITMVKLAREHGAVAASAFGAGFGGSVWALVAADGVHEFCRSWKASYIAAFPSVAHRADAFVTTPSPAAFRLSQLRPLLRP